MANDKLGKGRDKFTPIKSKDAPGALADPRFAAALTDPRFQRFPKSQRTVDIDERFAGTDFTRFCQTVAIPVQGCTIVFNIPTMLPIVMP